MPDKSKTIARTRVAAGVKPCPFCTEHIPDDLPACPFCNSVLVTNPVQPEEKPNPPAVSAAVIVLALLLIIPVAFCLQSLGVVLMQSFWASQSRM